VAYGSFSTNDAHLADYDAATHEMPGRQSTPGLASQGGRAGADGGGLLRMLCFGCAPGGGAAGGGDGKLVSATRVASRVVSRAGSGKLLKPGSARAHKLGASVLIGHRGRVATLSWAPSETLLASGGLDQSIRVWGVTDGACLRVITSSPQLDVRAVHWGGDDAVLTGTFANQVVQRWSMSDGSCLETQQMSLCGQVLSWSPNGRFLASVRPEDPSTTQIMRFGEEPSSRHSIEKCSLQSEQGRISLQKLEQESRTSSRFNGVSPKTHAIEEKRQSQSEWNPTSMVELEHEMETTSHLHDILPEIFSSKDKLSSASRSDDVTKSGQPTETLATDIADNVHAEPGRGNLDSLDERRTQCKSSDNSESNRCCICMTASKDVVFMPCLHLVTCKQCTENMLSRSDDPTCPVCCARIEKHIVAYV